MKYQRPFLKWVGGKHRLLDKLNRKLPKGERLVEPFVGSGAVFMGTDYDSYLLADSNPDLINLYQVLKDSDDWFIHYTKGLFSLRGNNREDYDAVRRQLNETDMRRYPELRASMFIWLNRHGFNGLCRYNASGKFNVPFGRYQSIYFPEDEMRAFAAKLRERDVTLLHGGYQNTFTKLKHGDVVYCDPPYSPYSTNKQGFVNYTPRGFNWQDHCYLAALSQQASQLGFSVVMSNHSERNINALYRNTGARLSFLKAARSINCDGGNRKPAREVLALWEAE